MELFVTATDEQCDNSFSILEADRMNGTYGAYAKFNLPSTFSILEADRMNGTGTLKWKSPRSKPFQYPRSGSNEWNVLLLSFPA